MVGETEAVPSARVKITRINSKSGKIAVKWDWINKNGLTTILANPLDLFGAPGVTRTRGTRIRNPLLYPPELRGHELYCRMEGCNMILIEVSISVFHSL